ncbi:MAG TPA: cell wall metabolism sensor histidine kinase WalK [Bacillota bacterium]|nr:cell wall metabolism sensor histidine kinase WalK [Bacillota bacterium]
MHKVGFFRSIQLKFIIIYILLLVVAIQIIGSYFSSKLEEELTGNFKESVTASVKLLNYNLEQAFAKERDEDSDEPTLEEEVQSIVTDVETENITNLSIQVITRQNRLIGTNDHLSRANLRKKVTNEMVQSAMSLSSSRENTVIDRDTGNRVYVKAVPIWDAEDNVVGAIYVKSSMESVFSQLQDINDIFFRGSLLAIVVSAIIGILVARTITKPLSEMRLQAQTMAKGDFSQKVNVYGTDEIGQFAATFNDLNDKLKHSRSLIEEERRKLSSVLSNMSDGVIATDKNGEVSLMNESAAELIGENQDDVYGEFLLDVLHLEDSVVDITDLRDSGSMVIDFSDEKEDFLIRANFSTIRDETDEITGFITVLSDVTEQEKVEQERREFVANVSHELRTPLTTMRSYIEALTDGAWEDKEIAPKFLGVTQLETERMIRMVNDLLQLSRMDNKDYSLQKERTNFTDYFHHVIDRFDMNVANKVTLKRDIPDKHLIVWMDKDKMTQVLDNIISNAIKYSPDGGSITLKVMEGKEHITVSISDQGVGIPRNRIDRIFDRFYRADKARSRKLGGTGLGLAIAKELVEAHHGNIWAKSKEGKGTTILFTLPLMNGKREG